MRAFVLALCLVGCSEYGIQNEPPGVEIADLEVDIDVDGDGVPDLNIDVDGDGIADINIDLDGDGIADINIDLDGDGFADINIDTDGDGTADVNIDLDGDDIPDINIDNNGDLVPDINVDNNNDTIPDENIDTDGDGVPDEDLRDVFPIAEVSNVDILFFGDTSGSMDEELAQIGSRIAEFTTRLATAGGDWQLAAFNGDQGCATDGIYTPDTPDWANRFAEAIHFEPNDGDTDEAGLVTLARSMNHRDPGECNEGMLRPNALVHAIVLSDENDESPGWDGNDPAYWEQYIDAIVTAKGGVQGLTRLSAITGPTPDGCDGSDPGFGYVEAMQGTGGTFLSICDDWEQQLDVLADASVVQNEFPLSVTADPNSIQVWMNQFPVAPANWSYNDITNTVSLDPAPTPGDVVEVFYERF